MYYYNARYYNPVLGRFISKDPLLQAPSEFVSDTQQRNGYAYAGNNPVMFVDWWGLDTAIIFYGGNEGIGNPNYFKDIAEANAAELDASKYDNGIIVIDGSNVSNWFNALYKYEDISYIAYYGHGNDSYLLIKPLPNENGKYDGSRYTSIASEDIKVVPNDGDISVFSLPHYNTTDNLVIELYSCNSATIPKYGIAASFAQHFNAPTKGARGGVSFGFLGFNRHKPYIRWWHRSEKYAGDDSYWYVDNKRK